tara:strand:- start:42388 stop:43053 length:666 start_codon:yes stop_codon:yes gene_type:complete
MMSEAFDTLVPDAQDFCRRLDDNNATEWFEANEAEFTARLKTPATQLLEALRPRIADLTGGTCSTTLFGLERDEKFARGEPPYKPHLHMMWSAPDEDAQPLGWFLRIELDRIRVGAGYMKFEGAALERWRAALAGKRGDRIDDAVGALMAQGCNLRAPSLKRVPAPYSETHPRGPLLRHKGLTIWADLPHPERDFDDAVMGAFALFWPAMKLVRGALRDHD